MFVAFICTQFSHLQGMGSHTTHTREFLVQGRSFTPRTTHTRGSHTTHTQEIWVQGRNHTHHAFSHLLHARTHTMHTHENFNAGQNFHTACMCLCVLDEVNTKRKLKIQWIVSNNPNIKHKKCVVLIHLTEFI